MPIANFAQEFIRQAIIRMEENTPRIEKCLQELSEEEIWQRPNEASNSVGNLILHLCGNITQYIMASLGRAADQRNRDQEFAATSGYTREELLTKIKTTVQAATDTIRRTSEEELLRLRSVQGFELSGIGIIIHVTEHYSYHTGQIAFWTKLLKSRDLGFYEGLDLNQKNVD